ncbi:MAG TPA: hypothetical protein VGR25_06435 [bacterium]|nr:hypothetical protein [bacterium]
MTERSGWQFKALGVFWILVGLISLGLAPLLAFIALLESHAEGTEILLGVVPLAALGLIAAATGWTLLTRRQFARALTLTSSVLLLLGLGVLVYLLVSDWQGIEAWAAAVCALLLAISAYGMWAVSSPNGRQMFYRYLRS